MKKISAAAAALAALSVLAGCASENAPGVAELTPEKVTVTATAKTTAGDEKDTSAETDDDAVSAVLFGEDYDPFADDYDPYADGIYTVTVNSPSAENGSGDENTSGEGVLKTNALTGVETSAPDRKVTAKKTEPTKSVTAKTETKKQTETSKKEETAAKKKTDDKITLEIGASNSWENGSDKFTQLDGFVKNNSDGTLSGWTVTVKAAKGVSVDQYWNCNITEKDGVLTITPVEWNTSIEAGRDGSFGMILKNSGKIDPSAAKLTAGSIAVTASAGSGNNNGNNNNNSNNNNNNDNNNKAGLRTDIPAPSTDDWLSAKGNKIVDSKGKTVWLTGVNWFGYNTGTNTFDGLWTSDLNTSITAIADHGFNLIRIPISAELIKNWSEGTYPTANFNQATNSYLVGMNSLEIFDYVIGSCRAEGIKVMIDIHSAKTDASGHMYSVWYNGNITEKDYLNALGWMAKRYKNDDTIIAYDLKNEPHGKANESPRAKWDNSKDSDNWKYIAEKAAAAVLKNNPNVLIMVEGIEIYPKDIKKNGNFTSKNPDDYFCTWWGGNLRGVKDNPVDLGKFRNKLVYSPHDYGPTVYEQPWFKGGYDYKSLYRDAWHDNWLYITENNTAPLLVGEWGGFMKDPNLKWMTCFRKLIAEYHLSHTFWCFNANSGDTGGLVKDDFTTWDTEKYNFVKEVLWQQDGKFVGLDHKIPLGDNGINLSDAKPAY